MAEDKKTKTVRPRWTDEKKKFYIHDRQSYKYFVDSWIMLYGSRNPITRIESHTQLKQLKSDIQRAHLSDLDYFAEEMRKLFHKAQTATGRPRVDLEIVEKQARRTWQAIRQTGQVATYNMGSLYWYVPPVVLTNTDDHKDTGEVGPFYVTLSIRKALLANCFDGILGLQAASSETPKSVGGRIHPHASDSGRFCMGEGVATVGHFLRQGRIFDAMMFCEALIRGYRGRQAFCRLNKIVPVYFTCPTCGNKKAETPYRCAECGKELCIECRQLCDNCGEVSCDDHTHETAHICPACEHLIFNCQEMATNPQTGQHYHKGRTYCYRQCHTCGQEQFLDKATSQTMDRCRDCSKYFCYECKDANKKCTGCEEKHQEKLAKRREKDRLRREAAKITLPLSETAPVTSFYTDTNYSRSTTTT